ncbi:MAG: PilZ domain-containing protein [Pseudomonadota bacterium]
MDERRDSPRLKMYAGVFILRGEKAYLTEVENVSTGGASMTRPSNWDGHLESRCALYFIIEQDHILLIRGHLVHETESRLGFEFDSGFAAESEELVTESRRWR